MTSESGLGQGTGWGSAGGTDRDIPMSLSLSVPPHPNDRPVGHCGTSRDILADNSLKYLATEATRRFIEALVGGRTWWRERCEQDVEALGVPWSSFRLNFVRPGRGRRTGVVTLRYRGQLCCCWCFSPRHRPELEADRREIAADTARASTRS
jgi:hypothetical protein